MKNNFITNEDMIKCIDESNDGIMISDAEGRILYVNASYLNLTKLDKTILGHNIDEYVSKGIITKSTCLSCIKYQRTYTHVHHEKNGVEIITVSKPVFSANGELEYTITNVRDISSYVNINQNLMEVNEKIAQSSNSIECGDKEIIANSPEMMQVIDLAKTVSKVDASVLILGETGVGKDVVACYIHKNSPRACQRFITLNCGAIPGELMESELFGYTPGSFTGGLKEGKKGILHYAQNGTLFLDEIGELPQYLQVKLLRVLENRVYSPIGSVEEIPIDIRIIAATNQNIQEQIQKNRFREDLYYRLSVVTINIPPLRERQSDIIPLAVHFLKRYTSKYGITKKLGVDTLIQLQQYDWPGNVRELKNMIEKMVILSQGNTLDFPSNNNMNRKEMSEYKLNEYMERMEKEYLINVKKLFSSTRQMAEAIGVDHSTVVRKFKKYNL